MTLPYPSSPNLNENIADSIDRIEQNLEYLDDNLVTGTSKLHTATRAMAGVTGNVDYTVADITAKSIIVFAVEPAGDLSSWGFIDEDGLEYCVYLDYDGNYASDTSSCVHLLSASGKSQTATWVSYSDGSFRLLWTNTGSPGVATATLIFLLLA